MTLINPVSLLPLMVGLPLFAAITSIVFHRKSWRCTIHLSFASVQLIICILILLGVQQGNAETYRYALGGWGAPLGIDLFLDGLTLIMLLVSAFLVFFLSIYSARYFADPVQAGRFWPLWWLLVAGLHVAFLAADIFNIYIALEMIGLSAVALVGLAGTKQALSAALRYALVGLLGSMCYLLGIVLLYRVYGSLDLSSLGSMAQANPLTWASLSLISIGLLLKTALFPLHFWLPPAHASAPGPVSAVLSALVVKASFYLLIRFWLESLLPATTTTAMNLLGGLGAVAMIWGCIAACRTHRLKLLVAYSTVAQLGYLFLLFPLFAAGNTTNDLGHLALMAIGYFMIAHAIAKAAMFLAAGDILSCHGHDQVNQLQGLVHTQPVAVATFAIAGASLIGLPPSSGFIAKWLLLNAAIESGQWWWVIIILSGGLFAAVYIGRVLNIAFSQPKEMSNSQTLLLVPKSRAVSGLMLAITAVILGFNAEWILNLLGNFEPQFVAQAGGL